MLKKAVKYQATYYGKAVMAYYATMSIILIALICLAGEGTVAGVSIITMFAMFILALYSFADNFEMLIQNGISRKTVFYSYIIKIIGVSLIMSFVSSITSVGFNLFMEYDGMIYGVTSAASAFILRFLDGFLFTALLYMVFAIFGYLTIMLFYKMGKRLSIAVSVGVPALFLAAVLLIVTNLENSATARGIWQFLLDVAEFINQFNPYLRAIVLLSIIGVLSYMLIKRIVVKTT